jgi:hypothetical protein
LKKPRVLKNPAEFPSTPNCCAGCCRTAAIELYTPIYQLFLPGRDFRRASNSLQPDETVGLYVSRLLGNNQYLGLLNNKHPLVPLPTTGAGYRLLLHGLASESLHAILREHKRKAAEAGV